MSNLSSLERYIRTGGGSPPVIANTKMSYHNALNYLAQKTSVIELFDQCGGRIAVCPEWNGRVMTSSCEGLEGESFGCINIQAIDLDNAEDFGGEDQWTISPLNHSFMVDSIKENEAILKSTVLVPDANGILVEAGVERIITLFDGQTMGYAFGDAVTDAFDQQDVSIVGFNTENIIRPRGESCFASRLRGMFNASPNTVLFLQTPPEGPCIECYPIKIDYLGSSPHGRIRRLPRTLLFRADGQGRYQGTLPYLSAMAIFGAVELRYGILTLWSYVYSNDSDDNMIRIYNSGHSHTDNLKEAAYYEMNSFSAAQELLPGDSLTHCQVVLHINADNDILENIVREIFDISLDAITQKMYR